MSIWSDNYEELEETMADILVQRIKSGEHLHMTELEIEDVIHISELVTEREGEDYLFSLMDEAMETFIGRQVDAAEAAVELQRDREVEDGQEEETGHGQGT